MMEVLMIGNGFDLSCNLPTTYQCFLLTIRYIISHYIGFSEKSTTIYEVFNALKNRCEAIEASINTYGDIYKEHEIDSEFIWKLNERCTSNKWWQYFSNNGAVNIGWIDFEKEIKKVLDVFDDFFKKNERIVFLDNCYYAHYDEASEPYLRSFNFFFKAIDNDKKLIRMAREPFFKKHAIDTAKLIIDKDKITSVLYEDLVDFMGIMREYFKVFVDDTLDQIKSSNSFKRLCNDEYRKVNEVISFNYTNSMEKLYDKSDVAHIHGETDNKIVLGINSDKNDEKDGDITFIPFKKYYQRVICRTDYDYLNVLSRWANKNTLHYNIHLSVVGHSLDETDGDVIEELFNAADRITIYCYKKEKKALYFRNLVNIFGKKKLDELRLKKQLKFIVGIDFAICN